MEEGMTHEEILTVWNGSHLGKAPRRDLSAVSIERKRILLVVRGRSKDGERGIEGWG